jgi:asparagine synthase (glutamine-hydrolysing)
MSTGFLGGIWKRGPIERRPGAPTPEAVNEDWGWVGQRSELFLRGDPVTSRLFRWDGLAILLRGYARPAGGTQALDLERVAEELRCHYLEHGSLAVDDLDGSFTVALLDSQAERVLLYRNLVGTGFTYYHPSRDGLLFSGNLAELLALASGPVAANRGVLPAFFLFRCVPGRETLFRDFYRLLPGEQICWDRRGLTRQQRHTFASLRGPVVGPDEAPEQVEATMAAILSDCVAHRPGAVNLLSGGVDSSYIQAVLARVAPAAGRPASYSVSVEHPTTRLDDHYALTASAVLGTRHRLVPAEQPYSAYLHDALATTAEPLNHVQSAYFGHLARVMRRDGISAGLCGEGADSLFGVGLANQFHNAGVLRRLLPVPLVRGLAGGLARRLGWSRLAATCRLANGLDDFADLEHPVNRVAAFADRAAALACFGPSAVAGAAADRRRLLDLYAVPYAPQDRLHAAGFLGEAMDSAGLWATLFQRAGVDLLCPFLDSRMLRLGLNLAPEVRFRFRRPKYLLKRALARHAGEELATRCKLGFGQPIFEWLAPGGQLAPLAGRIGPHDFIEPTMLERTRRQPTWFLYSLVVYDAWHRLFIVGDRRAPTTGWRAKERALPER